MITERMQREVSSFANPSTGSGNYDLRLSLDTQSPHPNLHTTKLTVNTDLHEQAPEKDAAYQVDCTPPPAEARLSQDPGVTDAV